MVTKWWLVVSRERQRGKKSGGERVCRAFQHDVDIGRQLPGIQSGRWHVLRSRAPRIRCPGDGTKCTRDDSLAAVSGTIPSKSGAAHGFKQNRTPRCRGPEVDKDVDAVPAPDPEGGVGGGALDKAAHACWAGRVCSLSEWPAGATAGQNLPTATRKPAECEGPTLSKVNHYATRMAKRQAKKARHARAPPCRLRALSHSPVPQVALSHSPVPQVAALPLTHSPLTSHSPAHLSHSPVPQVAALHVVAHQQLGSGRRSWANPGGIPHCCLLCALFRRRRHARGQGHGQGVLQGATAIGRAGNHVGVPAAQLALRRLRSGARARGRARPRQLWCGRTVQGWQAAIGRRGAIAGVPGARCSLGPGRFRLGGAQGRLAHTGLALDPA